MNRETFYFDEVLKKERLNSEFDNTEQAIWNSLVDQGVVGILSGGQVTPSTSSSVITVKPFRAVDLSGRRMQLRLLSSSSGDVLLDGGGRVTGTGAQTAYAAFGGRSDAAGVGDVFATGFTWPQQMAAAPSSVTLSAGITADLNVAAGGGFAPAAVANAFGGELKFQPTDVTESVYCARKVIAVP